MKPGTTNCAPKHRPRLHLERPGFRGGLVSWKHAIGRPLFAFSTDLHTARDAIDQRLADAHITPLWYPEGEHEYVEQILLLLLG